jgi:hypothetical protein
MGLFGKWDEGIGTVLEKWDEDKTNPGAPPRYWHYLLVNLVSGERVAIRLDKKYFDLVTIGDQVRFRYLIGKRNKKVKEFEIIQPVKL